MEMTEVRKMELYLREVPTEALFAELSARLIRGMNRGHLDHADQVKTADKLYKIRQLFVQVYKI